MKSSIMQVEINHKYVVLIHYKDQQEYPEIMYLNEAHTPEFIK